MRNENKLNKSKNSHKIHEISIVGEGDYGRRISETENFSRE